MINIAEEAKERIFIAGHTGMVGSAIFRRLQISNNVDLLLRTRSELDLTSQRTVFEFFQAENISQIYLAAAKVGGISANDNYPADFIYQNLMIQTNVIHSAHMAGVQKLLFLGSSCIYPKLALQPMKESYLLGGSLEETNEPYAVAKIAGIKLCESYNRQYGRDYRSVMPTNLYGPNDNFHLENSHVIPGLIRRLHDAKVNGDERVVAWGSGKPCREFLYVDDMADAAIHVMNLDKSTYDEHTEPMLSHINVGSGVDCSVAELVGLIAKIVGFEGEVVFDSTKPDGTPRKLMDVTRLKKLGWCSTISLIDGLTRSYEWYLENQDGLRF